MFNTKFLLIMIGITYETPIIIAHVLDAFNIPHFERESRKPDN